MKSIKYLLLAAAGIAVAACSSSDTVPTDVGADSFGSNRADFESTQTSSLTGNNRPGFIGFVGEQAGDAELIQNNLIVYFEFDSSEIRAEFNPMLAAHARYLAAVPNMSVRLEGHADERGSREYNIGLGEQRAQAVRQILSLQGVTSAQLSTVSYGEERPAAFGSDEEAYGLNRRVELVYR